MATFQQNSHLVDNNYSTFTRGIDGNEIDLVRSRSILGAPFTRTSVTRTKSDSLGVVIGVSVGEVTVSWRLMKQLATCVSRR